MGNIVTIAPGPEARPATDDARAGDSSGADASPASIPDHPPIENAQSEVDVRNPEPTRSAGAEGEATKLPGMPRSYIPPGWRWMGGYTVLGLGLAGVVAGHKPSIDTVVASVLAVLLCLLTPLAVRWDQARRRKLAAKLAVAAVVVVLPMALIGYALAVWMLHGNLNPYWCIATMLCCIAAANALLYRRLMLLLAGKVALWTPFVMLQPTTMALLSFAAACIVTLWLTEAGRRAAAEKRDARSERERHSERAERILRDYEAMGQGWFWETDRQGHLTYLTGSVARALGLPDEGATSRPIARLFEASTNDEDSERTLSFHLSARTSFQELPVSAQVDGEERWWSISGQPVHDIYGNFTGFRGWGTDLTQRRRSEQHASRLAHYDSLTGLANRMQMGTSLQKILDAPLAHARECSVMLLDLDRFKHVNDTMGHPAGDALLKQVAQRLERVVDDEGRVGRLGGDEFQVVLPGRLEQQRLAEIARDIIGTLSQPYSLSGKRAVIGASVGIATCPQHGTTVDQLMRNADLALYAAKDGGRGRHHFYASDLHAAAEERSVLEADLRDALAHGALELHYQPTVSIAHRRITGFEALLRWNHPTRGWLSPAKFVPIAEDTGLVEQIGEWALREACRNLALWPREVHCAVNVSPLQFANPNLPVVVTNAIAQAGIDPSRLELEITESVFLSDDANTDAMFAALKRIGVRMALDDFGTGYSSLGYLKKAPFDKIKIDQSFVRGATEDGSRNGAIIASITGLAEALQMDTTAEGVETVDELELVETLGCSHVQGFIYEGALDAAGALARCEEGLEIEAVGPTSARQDRRRVLRRVAMQEGDDIYDVTIRNISTTGALLEGLRDVPQGCRLRIALSDSFAIDAEAVWSRGSAFGVQFFEPLETDRDGRILVLEDRVGDTSSSAAA